MQIITCLIEFGVSVPDPNWLHRFLLIFDLISCIPSLKMPFHWRRVLSDAVSLPAWFPSGIFLAWKALVGLHYTFRLGFVFNVFLHCRLITSCGRPADDFSEAHCSVDFEMTFFHLCSHMKHSWNCGLNLLQMWVGMGVVFYFIFGQHGDIE